MTEKKRREKKGKRISFLVATNVIASRSPERRPTGNIIQIFDILISSSNFDLLISQANFGFLIFSTDRLIDLAISYNKIKVYKQVERVQILSEDIPRGWV